MNKKAFTSAILVLVILLAGALVWAFQRGAVYFEEGSALPHFSRDAITNPVPKLGRAVSYPADFPEEGKVIYEKNVSQLTATLEQDPQNYEAWLDLAIYYRMVGDHEGAVDVWYYLRNLYPTDGVSRHNLGEYYFHEEKKYEKAETFYEESIAAAPYLDVNYTDLYEMYRYVYKQDTTAAVDILKQGIGNVPDGTAMHFKILLGRHYRDVSSDKENARKYLTEARDTAQAAGERGLASDLTTEINAL